jgi:ergothioneine biosynthesis protein EgtB
MSACPPAATDPLALWLRYKTVRARTLALAEPLSSEDQCVQSMPDASPTKWHLAHTAWFFETALLQPHSPGYRVFDPRFGYLFNSYYEALGPRHPRPQRGLLTRPTVAEVLAYRQHVDEGVETLLASLESSEPGHAVGPEVDALMALGLNHEEQHQELLLTDILHAFSCNPLLPSYHPAGPVVSSDDEAREPAGGTRWLALPGGAVAIGHGGASFSFDNETPRHTVLLQPFAIADRLVTCGEFARFIEDGGYQRPELWLSDGWSAAQAQGWRAPACWLGADDPRLLHQPRGIEARWHVFGLHGVRPMDPLAPVSQLSFYEAAAYAEWAGARLPTEFEWEAASAQPTFGQATGHVWQWTRSSYDPYPGFRPMPGVAAEYNGKFMVGQLVLRGGSLATPPGHARPSYRNFFPPAARWQFTGLRLAKDMTR